MSDLYDEDVVLWSERQAHLLRRRAAGELINDAELDWPNIAEEIEALGVSDRRELRRRVLNILIHLMKLQVSPAIDPRAGWRETIREQRDGLSALLKDSPSLDQRIPKALEDEIGRARQRVGDALADHGEQPGVDLELLTYSAEQVLGPWLP